jgi:alpha-beta hydrolase superfamily lysophospholipase
MSHFEFPLKSKDGLRLFAQGWEPEGPPHGLVCLVHGLGEHSSRYDHVARFLNRAGYVLLAFDLRGHGRSEGPRGHSPAFEAFMQDIDLFLAEAGRRYSKLQCFLYGHSLGGLLALNYVLRRKPRLAGVVVTGPGLHTPLTEQKLKINFARVMGALLPTVSLSTGLDVQAISRDPAVVQNYQSDPLVHDRSTLRMAKTTLEAIPWAFEHAHEFDLPLLLMHGAADRLTYPSGIQEFAGRVQCECTVRLWEGCYHELHNEPEQEAVLAALVEWLDRKV